LIYTDGIVPFTQTGITSSPYVLTVTPTQATTYSILNVSNACGNGVSFGNALISTAGAPTASLTGGASICSGGSASLSIGLTGVGPWSVTYTDGTTPVSATGINSSPYIVSVTPAGSRTYSLVSVSNSGCGSGIVSGQAIVNIQSPPTATISGSSTVCVGSNGQLTIALTGSSPWQVGYTDGTTTTSISGIVTSPYTLSVSAMSTRTYTLTSVLSSCPGTVSGSGVVQILPSPTGVLTGSAPVCPGNGTNLSVTLTGSSPWSVTYTDGTTPTSVTGITASPFVFGVTPISSRSYSLQSITDALCSGLGSGVAVVNVNSAPVATLSGNQQVCSGSVAQLTTVMTGSGPWNLTYTNGTTPVVVTGITSQPYVFGVTPTSTTTYSLVTVVSGCTGSVSGTAVVGTIAAPTAQLSGQHTICLGGTANLSVQFTGASPWTLSYTDGTQTANINGITANPYFVSVNPVTTRTYSLVSVGGSCAGTVSGTSTVVVNTLTPNAVLSGSATICPNTSVNLTVNLSGSTPWSLIYTDGIVPFTQTGITSSPYVLTVTPTQATTYSILNVSNACGNGVSFGNAIVNPIPGPIATLSGSGTICPGGAVQLNTSFTGNGPWQLTWTNGTTPVTVSGITNNPYQFAVAPVSSTTYSLTAVSAACTGTPTGSAQVFVTTGGPTASISVSQTVCTVQPTTLSVAMTGISPWTMTYTDGVSNFTQTGLTSSPYLISISPTFSRTYSLVSIGDQVCIGSIGGSPAQVTVISPPTAALSGSQTICSGQNAILNVALTGQSPWNLTYSNGTSTVTVTGINTNPYSLVVGPTSTSTYSLGTVQSVCSGSVSGNAIVQVNVGGPTAVFSTGQTICSGSSTSLPVNLNGVSPWDLTYSNGTTNTAITGILNSPYVFSITPSNTSTYTVTSISDALCTGISGSTSVVQVLPIPTATLSGTQTVCSGNTPVLTVNLTGSGPWNVVWTNGTTPVTVTGIMASPYLITTSPSVQTTYSLVSVQQTCTGSVSGTAIVSVAPALNAVLTGGGNVCPGGSTNLSISFAGAGPWNFTYSQGTTSVTLTGQTQNPYVFGVSPTSSTTYVLQAVSNNTCTGTFSGQANINLLTSPTANLSGGQFLCGGQSAQISFNLTGSNPWLLRYSDGVNLITVTGISSSPYVISVTPSATSTYLPTLVNNGCPGTVSGSHIINVNPAFTTALSAPQGICIGGSANLTLGLTGTAPWTVDYSDGVTTRTLTGITGSPYQWSVSPVSNTIYTITSVADLNCSQTGNLGSALVSIISPPSGTITGTTTICAGSSTQLNFFLTGISPWTVQYTDGTTPNTITGIVTSPYSVSVTPTVTQQYLFTGMSDQSCSVSQLNQQAIVSVIPGPTAGISGNRSVCPGQSVSIPVTLTGTAPWTLSYTNGVNVVTVPGIFTSTYSLVVSPLTNTTYTLLTVNDNTCSGSVSGAVAVTVNAQVSATITGSTVLCAGNSTALSAQLTGAGPWTLVWSDGQSQVQVTGITSSPYVWNVSPNTTSFYTLVSVQGSSCSGTVSGTAIVSVGTAPTASFGPGANICLGQTALVGVSLNGSAPWQVSYTDGVSSFTVTGITTSTLALSLAPTSTTTYTLQSVNDAACTGTILNTSAIVNVSTLTPIVNLAGNSSICSGNIASLLFTFTGSAPWSVTYFNGISNQTLTGITASPYLYNVAPTVSTTYTPVAVSNVCGNGAFSGSASVQVITQAPISSFTYSVTGNTVTFTNTSSGGGIQVWSFGDGNTSTTSSPVYTYGSYGLYTVSLTVTNACGTFTSTQQIAVGNVSVDASTVLSEMKMYPNPSTGKFYLSFTGLKGDDIHVNVVDAAGKSIKDEKHFGLTGDHILELEIKNHSAGMYFVEVSLPSGAKVQRKLTILP